MNKNIVILSITTMVLNGCGNYNLGFVKPQDGKNSQQQQLDTLECQNIARLAASSAGMQVGAFFLGATIIGIPLVYVLDKSTQRDEFSNCMQSHGYTVLPTDTIQTVSSTDINLIKPSTEVIKLSNVTLPLGFNKLDDKTTKTKGWQITAINGTLDIGMLAATFKRNTISDIKSYASSKKAEQESTMTESRALDATEVFSVKVNDKEAFRYQYNTIDKTGLKRTYQITIIEYNQDFLHTVVWTSSSNFTLQKSVIESVPSSLLSQITN